MLALVDEIKAGVKVVDQKIEDREELESRRLNEAARIIIFKGDFLAFMLREIEV